MTTAATSVTRSTATLNAKAACAGGPCSWYFRYGTNNLYQYQTPSHVVDANTDGQQAQLPGENVSDLMPGTTYQYQLCGEGDSTSQITCVGPDGTPNTSEQFQTPDSKADCVYTANNVFTLLVFSQLVDYRFRCALTFTNDSQQWAQWEVPWFTTAGQPVAEYYNWQDWKNCTNPDDPCAAGEKRQLIITTQLWPSSEDNSDPLAQCSQGNYNWYAVTLASNLVSDGLGDSIIRIQQEGNDTSVPEDLPTDGTNGWPTGQEEQEWARCWSNEAQAMKAVPGAHFRMDWTINAYWRPIPLADWYPGDRAVDIIGIDAYDGGLPPSITSEPDAWTRIYTQPDGIQTAQEFAAQHGKPMSFSEWGLGYPGSPDHGLGDDPVYVDKMAAVVRLLPFAYQSYLVNGDAVTLLLNGGTGTQNESLTRYIAHFGGGGDATGSPTITP